MSARHHTCPEYKRRTIPLSKTRNKVMHQCSSSIRTFDACISDRFACLWYLLHCCIYCHCLFVYHLYRLLSSNHVLYSLCLRRRQSTTLIELVERLTHRSLKPFETAKLRYILRSLAPRRTWRQPPVERLLNLSSLLEDWRLEHQFLEESTGQLIPRCSIRDQSSCPDTRIAFVSKVWSSNLSSSRK